MFTLSIDRQGVRLEPASAKKSFLQRAFGRSSNRDLQHLSPSDRDLILALADVRALAADCPDDLEIASDHIRLSHRLAAALPADAADVLGLPPLVDLTLKTDAEGIVGSPSFRLKTEWFRHGVPQTPQRTGAILQTSDGLRRLPLWIMDALDVAAGYRPGSSDIDDWWALARFRQALDPGVRVGDADHAARISMTDFLSGLQVRVADRLSIAANSAHDDFEVLPFSGRRIDEMREGTVTETDSELGGEELKAFQTRVRQRGAVPAYRLGHGSFLVVDRSALPALEVMAEMQRASVAERAGFIRNPRPRITDAIEKALRQNGALDGLDAEAEEEAIENAAGPIFVETREYSERVTGIGRFEKLDLGGPDGGATTWLPEEFARRLGGILSRKTTDELEQVRDDVRNAMDRGEKTVPVEDVPLPACQEAVATVEAYIETRRKLDGADVDREPPDDKGPFVLFGDRNVEDVLWEEKLRPRKSMFPVVVPRTIRTQLKEHQVESFHWQVEAWKAGLPGILNADEQGLGKTLQTIAFLVWLKTHMAQASAQQRGPILVVAPTSLLENWRQEVARHVEEPGLGHLIPLYGAATGSRKLAGKAGRDIESGEAKLDLGFLSEAVEEGRAHRFWVLTTYTTLTNYQHSLARIPFSALVFDEIQNLKNHASLRAQAGIFMQADFRIGLTGTPIENSAVDLWAIMEQLAPGSLGSHKEFRQRYASPDAANMAELHGRVFGQVNGRPSLALRRIKDEVARDLPGKTRRIHPRRMPDDQASVYDQARLKLAQGGRGAALKMLHHIRSVSVHPELETTGSDSDFITASARLTAAFDVLRRIKAAGERALVFIEHRQLQYRFIELARAEFGLNRIDLINGETPIPQRQAIVERFQRHLEADSGFDLLVLGPKAAGVGLTLTAATHVIHLSRWWNPAVEEQCNDRVHRIGQTRPVQVHLPMAIHPGYRENSFDCLLHSLMQRKRKLASSALWPMGDTEADAAELRKLLAAETVGASEDPVQQALVAMFQREGQALPRASKTALSCTPEMRLALGPPDGSSRLPNACSTRLDLSAIVRIECYSIEWPWRAMFCEFE